jgi:cytoskeletal protein RodZ
MFAFAREARGIPIEQAAHETRIRLKCLRELEADDLSHLSPAYARMFIVDYAKYLGVPTASIKSHLPDVGDFGTEGYQYIQNTASPDPEVVRLPTVRRSKSRALFVVCAFLLASFGGFKVWTIWRNLGNTGPFVLRICPLSRDHPLQTPRNLPSLTRHRRFLLIPHRNKTGSF